MRGRHLLKNASAEGPRVEERGKTTQLLLDASHGNRAAFDQLLPLVYDELKELARRNLRRERDGHTLNATALVHEAYMRLVQQERVQWQSRAHFFALAAMSMRRILVNYAATRGRGKRGGGAPHVPIDEQADTPLGEQLFSESQALELLALDEALTRLRAFNEVGANVVQYRFFGGLSYQDIAEVLGTSEMTVRRRWGLAKTWLRRELDDGALSRTTRLLTTDQGD